MHSIHYVLIQSQSTLAKPAVSHTISAIRATDAIIILEAAITIGSENSQTGTHLLSEKYATQVTNAPGCTSTIKTEVRVLIRKLRENPGFQRHTAELLIKHFERDTILETTRL